MSKYKLKLKQNGYEIFTGKALINGKKAYASDIDVTRLNVTNLGLFNFRSFLNLGMLLTESERAKELRQLVLDITLDVINKKNRSQHKIHKSKG